MGHRRTHSAQGIPAQDPPARNDVNLNRSQLYTVLNYLASLLIVPFKGEQVTLYVHGGAVMVMHPGLVSRPTTRDVDVCLRGFDQEWEGKVKGAEQILRACIRQTATVFHLGADWMNSDPDVALPWAFDAYGRRYDPLISSAKSQKNIEENAIYTSSSLRLVGVTWQWGVALKLFRYRKNDPCDVACILFYGMQRGSTWSRTVLEAWIRKSCGLMGYDNYSPEQLTTFRGNMRDAIRLAYQKAGSQPPPSSSVIIPSNLLAVVSTFQAIPAVPPPLPPSNSHARSSSGPFLGFRSHHSHGSQLSVF